MMAKGMMSLVQAIFLSILFLYLVMAAQFESFIDPISIMFALPLAIIGAILGLFVFGSAISMICMIGLIMLMGLVAQTEAGDVSVLGTKFLVVQQGKKMLVNCEEGSVKVATPVGQRTLTAGQSVRCDETKIVPVERKVPTPEAEYPEVLGYEDDPLINVVADIEQIFKLTVIGHEK